MRKRNMTEKLYIIFLSDLFIHLSIQSTVQIILQIIKYCLYIFVSEHSKHFRLYEHSDKLNIKWEDIGGGISGL